MSYKDTGVYKIPKYKKHPEYKKSNDVIVLKDGEPCNHKGCLNHISHPCEGCGRISGEGKRMVKDE